MTPCYIFNEHLKGGRFSEKVTLKLRESLKDFEQIAVKYVS